MAVRDLQVVRPPSGRLSAISPLALLLLAASIPMADAHDHDSTHIEDGQAVSAEPIDTTLWVHIFIQMAAWGVIFPTGMVLGVRIAFKITSIQSPERVTSEYEETQYAGWLASRP
jgi:hypothetical protein